MATISNLQLTIDNIHAQPHLRRVKVTYQIHFNSAERMANSVFREKVTLHGDDAGPADTLLHTIRNGYIQATQNPVPRNIEISIARQTLDEDPDTMIGGMPVGDYLDEVYARVSLTPFVPASVNLNSSPVIGTHGEYGNP